ncbi:MAG: glycosyltransferase, partial [Bacteroidia bacterium]
MNYSHINWALVVPMANEETEFDIFIKEIQKVLNKIGSGKVYLITDTVSKDRTTELCNKLSENDKRFVSVFAPENKNVVDAYLRGYKEAYNKGHEFIIEMDAGLSHNPNTIPEFLKAYTEGYECVFGSRFVKGGSMGDSPFKRRILSTGGTFLSNILLGTKLKDMTSGYQGFSREAVEKLIAYPLMSKAHFYQTEVRYLFRKRKWKEIPLDLGLHAWAMSRYAGVWTGMKT